MRSRACFISEAGIHLFSEAGYPTHLMKYRISHLLGLSFEMTTLSTS